MQIQSFYIIVGFKHLLPHLIIQSYNFLFHNYWLQSLIFCTFNFCLSARLWQLCLNMSILQMTLVKILQKCMTWTLKPELTTTLHF